ncbi:MAG: kelch repeat-containing protein [Planctomycetota bacterium]
MDWFPVPDLPGRAGASFSEDPQGTGVLRFGGSSVVGRHADMHRWDGAGWHGVIAPGGPSARDGAAMARDPVRGRVVLFGGLGFAANGLLLFQDDTWEFDGVQWTLMQPATKPPPRRGARMAWHAPSQRLILVGGEFLNTNRADTWEWDGTNWQLRTVATALPAMVNFDMAADPVRGRIVLHGGDTRPSSTHFGTFEWDGSDWHRMQPANPLLTTGWGLAFDRNRGCVIAQAAHWPPPSAATFEWDGEDWRQIEIAQPSRGGTNAVVEDPATGGVLMLDGQTTPVPNTETWLLDEGGWQLIDVAARPPASSSLGLVYNTEQERALAFLGSDTGSLGTSTWAFSRDGWQRLLPTVQPTRRTSFGMVFDSVRSRVLVFGGADSLFSIFDETWTFDGQRWNLLLPASRPPATLTHAMAFDSGRDRVVLFGGQSTVAPVAAFTQTWEFDGTDWIQRQPATVPPGRFGAVMAYDPLRGETIMFGGSLAGGGVGGDTWIWNGQDWSPRVAGVSPPPRFGASMAFDAARGVTVLTGGRVGPLGAPHADAWEWDGTAWTERVPVSAPLGRAGAGMAFVPWLDGCLIFGGMERTGHPEDAGFVYRPVDPARVTAYGSSCAGSLGELGVTVPVGNWPYIGRTLELEVAPVQPGRWAWFNFGISDRTAAGLPLPLDLSPIGMTGCRLLASIEASALVTASGASVSFRLPIPLQPALVGGELFAQVLSVDSAANVVGLISSHGVRLQIGQW